MKRISAIAGAIAFGLAAGAGVSVALDASAPAVIQACAANNNGSLRFLPEGESCNSKNETLVSWNAEGVPGPQGPSGPLASTTHWANTTAPVAIPPGNPWARVVGLHLPAGSYSIDGRIYVTRGMSTADTLCLIKTDPEYSAANLPIVDGAGELPPLDTNRVQWQQYAYNLGTSEILVAELELAGAFKMSQDADVGIYCQSSGDNTGGDVPHVLQWSWVRTTSVGEVVDETPLTTG